MIFDTIMAFRLVTLAALVAMAYAVADEDADDGHWMPDAVALDGETFNSSIAQKPHFVMFFAPWCRHCKHLAPTFNELAQQYNDPASTDHVTLATVDCTANTEVCAENDVHGYPSLIFYTEDRSAGVSPYSGPRHLDSLNEFVQQKLRDLDTRNELFQQELHKMIPLDEVPLLNSVNFETTITLGYAFIFFSLPTCVHCRQLAPKWQQLAVQNRKHKDIVIAKVDCDQDAVICTEQNIVQFPTLVFYQRGQRLDTYEGQLELDYLNDYIDAIKVASEEGRELPHASGSKVVHLTLENYDELIKTEFIFVNFYKPWCQHCKALAPTWSLIADRFTISIDDVPQIIIASVNCAVHSAICSKHQVTGYPTILHFHNGQMKTMYTGQHQLQDISNFITGSIGIHGEL